MKVCNYCGTGMDNTVSKCPFCGMEMNLKGAVSYQDNAPFTGTVPKSYKTMKGEKTAAEIRYESMMDDGFSSNLKEKIESLLADRRAARQNSAYAKDAKAAMDSERRAANVKKAVTGNYGNASAGNNKNASAGNVFAAPKTVNTGTMKNTNKNGSGTNVNVKKTGMIGVFLLGIFAAFAGLMALGFMIDEVFGDEYYYQEEYIGQENFIPGIYDEDENTYVNEYAGVKAVFGPDWIAYFEDEPYDLGDINEFHAYKDNDFVSISYYNKDAYSYHESTYEFIDEEKNDGQFTNRQFIADTTFYMGETTYTGYIARYVDDDGDVTYEEYLIADVTDDYYCVIEIESETYEGLDTILESFNQENGL